MAEERVQRRLAAILAADVVGYSRLMGADEVGTLTRLKSLRSEVFDPTTIKFDGRIFKNTGDGALAEFGSAVDAVQSAVEIQRALAQRNTDLPENLRITLRIGISLGDVIVEGDDLYGNGVNVAARMEGLAETGGICISGNVHEHVDGALDLSYEDLGEQAVKNIDRPVRTYRVRLDGTGQNRTSSPIQEAAISHGPSVAVLPFDNLSGDPEQEYFSDGMAEDLITDLSKISNLFVAARNSSFAFKGQMPDMKEVAEKLRVRYILEGSVRKMGDRLRINAQLIDARDGGHLWAERYDGNMAEIFDFQDRIRAEIISALKVQLTASDKTRNERRRTESVEAYDLYLKGRTSYFQYTPESHLAAKKYFEHAIEIDPNFADAYSYLSYCHFASWAFMWPGRDDDMERAVTLAEKGVALDPNSAITHTRLAWVQAWSGEFENAIKSFEIALSLEPNNAETHAYYGESLNFTEHTEKGVQLLQKAFQLEPMTPPSWYFQLGHAYYELRRYDEAVARFVHCIDRAPFFHPARLYLACTNVEMGRVAEAEKQIKILLANEPRYSVERVNKIYPYRDETNRQRFLNNLRKAGLPE